MFTPFFFNEKGRRLNEVPILSKLSFYSMILYIVSIGHAYSP